jgi:hypothetical protein
MFPHNGHIGFVILVLVSIEASSLSHIFSWVSPDILGLLWMWGSRCSEPWGSRRVAGVALLSGLLCGLLLGIAVSCQLTFYSSAVIEASCYSSSQIQFVLAAWAQSIACSMHSNWYQICSIVWQSVSSRGVPNLVFWVVLLVGGGAECLCDKGIAAWVPEGSVAGVVDLEVAAECAGLEEGASMPRGTVLKPRFFKGH